MCQLCKLTQRQTHKYELKVELVINFYKFTVSTCCHIVTKEVIVDNV